MNNFGIQAGQRFGSWEVLSADVTGKRIACRCSCGQVRVVAVSALESGANTSCGGCTASAPADRRRLNEDPYRQMLLSDFGWFEKI
jgi:hypothetical protein